MTVQEYQNLLGILYREDYKNDPVIAKVLIEIGWALNRLLDDGTILPFDEYEKVKSKIDNEVEWYKTWDC